MSGTNLEYWAGVQEKVITYLDRSFSQCVSVGALGSIHNTLPIVLLENKWNNSCPTRFQHMVPVMNIIGFCTFQHWPFTSVVLIRIGNGIQFHQYFTYLLFLYPMS